MCMHVCIIINDFKFTFVPAITEFGLPTLSATQTLSSLTYSTIIYILCINTYIHICMYMQLPYLLS